MRKLRVFESISVDGYFCDAGGDMSWAHAGRDDAEFADWVGGNASGGGELLFGRKTYQMMEAFWPTPMAAAADAGRGQGDERRAKVRRVDDDPADLEQHAALEGRPRRRPCASSRRATDRTSPCSAAAAWPRSSATAGLVDEYQFVIIPVALGGGRTVFTTGRQLRLVDQRAFRCGNVVVTYAT